MENNAKNLILMLKEFSDKQLYISKSFKMFINFMWEVYQPEILKKVFIPFVVYMISFCFMASVCTGDFLDDKTD